jgi:protein SCO1/2
MQDNPPPVSTAAGPTPGQLRLSPAWIAFAALALAVPIAALYARSWLQPSRLPVLATLPDFALVDQKARPFTRQSLAGRVWVADFVFTHCPDACPLLTQRMKSIQDQLTPLEAARGIGLLSVSVDPERDTPEVMDRYAQAYGVRDQLWHFLTGPQAEVERAVVQGFKVAMVKAPVDPQAKAPAGVKLPPPQGEPVAPPDDATPEEIHAAAFEILHGEKFVLVDAQGRIRGYYDVNDPKGFSQLLHDARLLASGGA